MKEQTQVVNVTVAGGYQPAEVHFQKGVPAQINFRRTSPQGCLDVVHSSQLGFAEQLPLDETKPVTINTDHAGEFSFSCGMDKVRGLRLKNTIPTWIRWWQSEPRRLISTAFTR